MTNKEAVFLLGASRPNGMDSADPEFTAALDQVSRDPVLEGWFENERRVDAAIARSLQGVPVPEGLRARILTGGRVSRPAGWFTARRLWAIAAMAALFAGLAAWFSAGLFRHPEDWEDEALAALSQLVSGRETFDVRSANVSELQQWLRANGSPSAGTLPASLGRFASLGCKMLWWNGHPVSIICFQGPGGEMVHLAMVDRSALASAPPEGAPVYGSRDGWQTASWSQGGTAMMLVTRGSQGELRGLLGFLF